MRRLLSVRLRCGLRCGKEFGAKKRRDALLKEAESIHLDGHQRYMFVFPWDPRAVSDAGYSIKISHQAWSHSRRVRSAQSHSSQAWTVNRWYSLPNAYHWTEIQSKECSVMRILGPISISQQRAAPRQDSSRLVPPGRICLWVMRHWTKSWITTRQLRRWIEGWWSTRWLASRR